MDPIVRRVIARVAAVKRLDLTWLEGLRKDFLTLLKNLPRVHDYATAHQLKDAVNIYRKYFKDLFFDKFLNKDLKYNLGLSEYDAGWIEKRLRGPAWGFAMELQVPIGVADDYRSEADCFKGFQESFPAWKTRVQRKAQIFWKEMREIIEYFERTFNKSIDVKVPAVDNTRLEGFNLVMRGYDPESKYNREELSVLKDGLAIYRERATAVAPILLRKQLPIVVEFEATLDKGGEYKHGEVWFFASSISEKGPKWVAHALAHEMGHHLYRTYLSDEAANFWYQTIKGDFGDLDLKELLDKWPGDTWAFEFHKAIGEEDPVLALQVEALTSDREYKDTQSKEDFQKLYDAGVRTIKVPKHPITGYANKNPEEAFCETLGLLVAYGPRAVDPRVRFWFETVMPGAVKMARTQPELVLT